MQKLKWTKCAKYVNKVIKRYAILDAILIRITIANAWKAGYKAAKREEKK